jgi:hypothetical protein
MPANGELYNPWRVFVGSFIPNAILRCRELSSTSKLVFGRLCQYAGENGQSYPTYRTLGHEVGIDRRQAIRAVKELEKFGLIQPCGRFRLDGGSTSNIYIFLWHRILAGEPSPGNRNDAGGECYKCHPPGGHERHQVVSNMTPRKKQTREKTSKETTTEQLRLLLSGTPLSEITDEGIRILINRHGIERLFLAADIAAETWRRERKEIHNPGGYLNSLCNSHVVPDWYAPLEERQARLKEAEEQKRQAARTEEERRTGEEKETRASEKYWHSLSQSERDELRRVVIATLPPGFDLLSQTVENVARSRAWKERSQMSNNGPPKPFADTNEIQCNQEVQAFE